MGHPASTDIMRDRYTAAPIRYQHQRARKQIRSFFGAVCLVLFLIGAMTVERCAFSPQPAVQTE